jgi:hypothetical protein
MSVSEQSATQKALNAWGNDAPEWVLVLAAECDRTTQARAAARIGRSPAVVSNTLACKYPGDLGKVEELVGRTLMPETIACPVLGEIPRATCRGWRDRTAKFSNVNTMFIQMFRACNKCPVHTGEEAMT